jgi:hypothetical protein
VIEVRMRDENGLEAPALRGDAISQLLRIADPELGIHEDGLVLAVDEGRRHADTLGVGGVDIERERGGIPHGRCGRHRRYTQWQARQWQFRRGSGKQARRARSSCAHLLAKTSLDWNPILRWMHNQPH